MAMRWITFTVLAATLVILASISVAVAVPTPTANAAVPRALKQYKMKRPDVNVKRDVLNQNNEDVQDNGQHHHPKPSHHWYPTTTEYWWKEMETSL